LGLLLALSADDDHPVLDRDLDVLLVEARQVGPEDDLVLAVDHVHGGGPPPLPLTPRPRGKPAEHVLHLVLQPRELAEGASRHESRTPTFECHRAYLLDA